VNLIGFLPGAGENGWAVRTCPTSRHLNIKPTSSRTTRPASRQAGQPTVGPGTSSPDNIWTWADAGSNIATIRWNGHRWQAENKKAKDIAERLIEPVTCTFW